MCFSPAGFRKMKCKMPPLFPGYFACPGTSPVLPTNPLRPRWGGGGPCLCSHPGARGTQTPAVGFSGADTRQTAGHGPLQPVALPKQEGIEFGSPTKQVIAEAVGPVTKRT